MGIEEPGRPDLNVYAYVRANPLTFVDEAGLEEKKPFHPAPVPGPGFPPSGPPPKAPPPPKKEQEPKPTPAPPPKLTADPIGELLKLVESPEFDAKKLTGKSLLPEQVRFILRSFLIATQELEERGLDTSNAVLLVAHAGVETSFAKPGKKNPNVAAGNVFSFQPLEPTKKELVRRGIEVPLLPRVNRIGGKLVTTQTPTPKFESLRRAIEVQLDLVFGLDVSEVPEANRGAVLAESFRSIGEALRQTDLTASQYGLTAAKAGYAGRGTEESKRYERALMGTYGLAVGVLSRFSANLPASVSPEARQFLESALAALAPRE